MKTRERGRGESKHLQDELPTDPPPSSLAENEGKMGKMIHEGLWRSEKLARCSTLAQLHYPRLYLLTDDWSCFEIDLPVIMGRVYPKMKRVDWRSILNFLIEYRENGLLFIWRDQMRTVFGYFTGKEEGRLFPPSRRHKRQTPPPPKKELSDYINRFSFLDKESEKLQDGFKVTSKDFKVTSNRLPSLSLSPSLDLTSYSDLLLSSDSPVNLDHIDRNKDTRRSDEVRLEFTEWLKDVMTKWNEFAKKTGVKEIASIKPESKRMISLKARFKDGDFDIEEILDAASEQRFLFGESQRGWQISFDWIILPSNYPKVLEKVYGGKKIIEPGQNIKPQTAQEAAYLKARKEFIDNLIKEHGEDIPEDDLRTRLAEFSKKYWGDSQ